jgi:hypothetical protein
VLSAPPTPRLDLSAPPSAPVRDRAAGLGAVAAVVWVAAVAAYGAGLLLGDGPGPAGLTAIVLGLAALAPVALLRALRAMAARAEAAAAEAAALRVELRALTAAKGQAGNAPLVKAAADAARQAAAGETRALGPRLDAVEAALTALAQRLEGLAEPRRAEKKTEAARAAAPADQPALPFAEPERPERAAPIAWADVVRAFDFPRDERDEEGLAAIRSTLRDPEFGRLLQAAEDVLSMLAAAGVHTEELRPEKGALAAWKAYAEGARGPRAAGVGGVLDEGALAVTRGLLREDPVFRDACLVYARRWSGLVARVFRELGEDPVMLEIADTRSGRAFMLTARALGAFD